jgi:hypothetical protein
MLRSRHLGSGRMPRRGPVLQETGQPGRRQRRELQLANATSRGTPGQLGPLRGRQLQLETKIRRLIATETLRRIVPETPT